MKELPLYWTAAIAFLIINLLLVSASVLVWAERRVAGFIQNRPGPNRVGPGGFLQPFADVAKLIFKEDIQPKLSNKFVHSLAPIIMVTIAMSTFAVIPFAEGYAIADVSVSALITLAMTSIAVYGVTLAGWASNSKYPLLGGLRSAAQMISYELSMGLCILSVILLTGSLRLMDVVEAQSAGWGILGWNAIRNPIAFILFVVTAFAETNRAPFDLPEAEQELVGGYHTEYSGMKFGMFFLAEYVNFFVASFVIATFFLGGYLLPFQPLILQAFPGLEGSVWLVILQILSLVTKAAIFAFIFIWVRWTLPRFKYVQLMTLGWKYMLPIALVNALVIALAVALWQLYV